MITYMLLVKIISQALFLFNYINKSQMSLKLFILLYVVRQVHMLLKHKN